MVIIILIIAYVGISTYILFTQSICIHFDSHGQIVSGIFIYMNNINISELIFLQTIISTYSFRFNLEKSAVFQDLIRTKQKQNEINK